MILAFTYLIGKQSSAEVELHTVLARGTQVHKRGTSFRKIRDGRRAILFSHV